MAVLVYFDSKEAHLDYSYGVLKKNSTMHIETGLYFVREKKGSRLVFLSEN
jgi:hypothetical protein